MSGSYGKCVATFVLLSGCREATSGRAVYLSSIVGDISPRLGNVGFGKAGTDRKSGVDLRSVGRRCQVLMSGVDVGRLTWCQQCYFSYNFSVIVKL